MFFEKTKGEPWKNHIIIVYTSLNVIVGPPEGMAGKAGKGSVISTSFKPHKCAVQLCTTRAEPASFDRRPLTISRFLEFSFRTVGGKEKLRSEVRRRRVIVFTG